MPERLFVYGSLQPGASNAHVLADVPGTWSRASVKGRLVRLGWGAAIGYDALILDDSAGSVPGQVLESAHLGERWEALDAFEGEDYERVTASVEREGGGRTKAFVYVLRGGVRAPGS